MMLRFSCLTILCACLLAGAVPAHASDRDAETPNPLGAYQGGGVNCLGRLVIGERYISWNTPFMNCKSRYRDDRVSVHENPFSVTYRLMNKSAVCSVRRVTLQKNPDIPGRGAWHAHGYDARGRQVANCALVKL